MIDWEALKVGDLDPEGPVTEKIGAVCGVAEDPERPLAYRCTRAAHADELHVASGLSGRVIHIWRRTR